MQSSCSWALGITCPVLLPVVETENCSTEMSPLCLSSRRKVQLRGHQGGADSQLEPGGTTGWGRLRVSRNPAWWGALSFLCLLSFFLFPLTFFIFLCVCFLYSFLSVLLTLTQIGMCEKLASRKHPVAQRRSLLHSSPLPCCFPAGNALKMHERKLDLHVYINLQRSQEAQDK